MEQSDFDQLVSRVTQLFEALNARQIPYLLVGGIAMLVHIEGRNTQDIDLLWAETTSEANAANRKATGIHNGADRAIPSPKGCRRGTGDSLIAGEKRLNWRKKLGTGFGL